MTKIGELHKRVEVVEQYCEGAQIECQPLKTAGMYGYRECDPGKYNWDWANYDYRVKS
jgi:hypothetical protein